MQRRVKTVDKRYYFDHNATTPVRKEVAEAMMPYLTERYGNASSVHSWGREAKNALEESRETVARLLGAEPGEIFFTGCGTESDNIALAGHLRTLAGSRRGLVTTAVEHSAILKTAARLERDGFPVSRVGVDADCLIDLDELSDSKSDDRPRVSQTNATHTKPRWAS
ncbi:MAG: aminotransferase class V-fold PLP-dependent enzyme, partial [Candidatus Latescibacteria bacterium]|nr:aminotransferase class V-fold PLP-dependent enzyme [Candidatus Latescibacterota bacterium]